MEPAKFLQYLLFFEKDTRLSSWHIALLAAVLALALRQGQIKAVRASRRRLMSLSHINTLPTFHKYFRDLQQLGYIAYRPSYHPGVRSEIDLLVQPYN